MKTIQDLLNEDILLESIMESGDIGTLCRKGRTIYYANLLPLHLGNTVEGSTKLEVARKLLTIANRA